MKEKMLEKQIIEDKIKEIRLDRIRFRSKRRLLLESTKNKNKFLNSKVYREITLNNLNLIKIKIQLLCRKV